MEVTRPPPGIRGQPSRILVMMSVDRQGRTELHYAALDGRAEEVGAALASGVDPSSPDHAGWTPLHFAAQSQHSDVAWVLIDGGAEVDAQDSYGKTPLHVALFNVGDGEGEVVRVLLEAGAAPDLKNFSGVSPKDLADRVANYNLNRFFA